MTDLCTWKVAMGTTHSTLAKLSSFLDNTV